MNRRVILWLVIILLFCLFARLWSVSHTVAVSRDCFTFVQYAIELDSPKPTADVLRSKNQAPGFPYLLLASHKVVTQFRDPSPYSWMLAGQIVCVVSGCMLVIPLYLLARSFYEVGPALWVTAFVSTLPIVGLLTADGISDAPYLLFLTLALACGVRVFQQPRWYDALSMGIFAGIAYLIRPEAILSLGACGLTVGWLMIRRVWSWKQSLLIGGLMLVGFAIIGGPYMLTIKHITNKNSGKQLISDVGGDDGPGGELKQIHGTKAILLEAGKHILRAGNYALCVLGIIGAIVVAPRIFREPHWMVMIIYLIVATFAIIYLGNARGYINIRHALGIAMVLSLLSMVVLPQFSALLAWLTPFLGLSANARFAIVCGLLVIGGYHGGFRRLHVDRAGHRLAGEWAAVNLDPNVKMIDPYLYTSYFAGRLYQDVTFEEILRKEEPGTKLYVVVEPRNPNPHSNQVLLVLPKAQAYAAKGKLVYRWPEEGPLESASVAIYEGIAP